MKVDNRVAVIRNYLNPASTSWDIEKLCFNRSSIIDEFFIMCDSIAPTEKSPLSITEYENNYNAVESELRVLHWHSDEIEDHIIFFLEKEMNLRVRQEQIHLLKAGLGRGLSGDPIYRVLDLDGKHEFIVKVFADERNRFSKEFFALMNHERLKLKNVHFPIVLGIGASKINGLRVYFLAMTYVLGTSINELYNRLFEEVPNSFKRLQGFETLKVVYRKLGMGFAELHDSAKSELLPLHPLCQNLVELFARNAFIKFEKYIEPSFLKALKDWFEEHFLIELENRFVRGYTHGDANGGNFLYDERRDCLVMIDLSDGAASIGKEGLAIGLPFFDVVQIRNEILMRTALGLTENERDELIFAFESGYGLEKYLSSESMNFFCLIDLMGSIKWYHEKQKFFDSSQLTMAKKLYLAKLEQLRELIA